MEALLLKWTTALLAWLALPAVGLPAVFLVALISATLLPMGSEPAVFALIKADASMFWPAILVATLGNTLGGGISWVRVMALQRAMSVGSAIRPTTPSS